MFDNKRWIKNFDELALTENRRLALEIAEAGLSAIATENVIFNNLKLEGDTLFIQNEQFDLSKFKRIKVVGFGKCSCQAGIALEKVLGEKKVDDGIIIGLEKIPCASIKTFAGTHPRPSEANIEPGKKIFELIENSSEEDLIIAIVSGGGSALLCYPENECEQGKNLYDAFLETGQNISEMNTVRKHLSLLKGGGLAKIAYPATVIGLIFSDVPGSHFEDVASGPTYFDKTTVSDAEKIISQYNLGNYELIETPKEEKYFEKVHNFVLVSNKTAVEAMEKEAKELGLKTNVVSTELYDEMPVILQKIFSTKSEETVVLAAGEPSLVVKKKGGKGGRDLYMALEELEEEKNGIPSKDSVFIALASDGMDNSDAAGAIVDKETLRKIKEMEINVEQSLEDFNAYPVFEKSGDMIMTGPTGANVSDLMILLTRKEK